MKNNRTPAAARISRPPIMTTRQMMMIIFFLLSFSAVLLVIPCFVGDSIELKLGEEIVLALIGRETEELDEGGDNVRETFISVVAVGDSDDSDVADVDVDVGEGDIGDDGLDEK